MTRLVLALAVCTGLHARAGSRVLTDGWRFSRDGGETREVRVPHDWAIEGPFDRSIDIQNVRIAENGEIVATEKTGRTGSLPWIGSGEYRLRFDIPAGAERASLYFHGAMSEPEVFVDGIKAGEWKYGYTPFEVEIPEQCARPGGHELLVRLVNRPESSRWYPGAGLYRPVELRWGRKIRIPLWGQSISTPDLETVVVKTEIVGGSADLSYRVLDAEGREVASGLPPFRLHGARVWTPESPCLYTLETTLSKDGAVLERRLDRFGVRTVSYGSDGFRLNGVKRKFRGVCLHHDLGPLGAAFSPAAFRRQLAVLKEMGCDAIRTAHNLPEPWQLDICDEAGFMVMAESFDSWAHPKVKNGYNLHFSGWWRRDLAQLVLSCRNHPCVVMWSLGNEIPEQTTARGAALTKEMENLVCALDNDPRRLSTQGVSSLPGALASGVVAEMDVPALTYRLPFYEQVRAASPMRTVLGAETASTVSSRGVYKFPDEPRAEAVHADGQCSGYDVEFCSWSNLPDDDWAMQDDNDWTMGEFVWTGFDYLGEPTPYDAYWPSRSSYFGICDLAGLPKDRYWLYRAHWNRNSPTLHILPHWNWPQAGMKVPVYVYTSHHAVELFLNGKSLGRRTFARAARLDRYRLRWRDVAYEPGELKAVAYDAAGKQVAETVVRTAGEPARLRLSVDRARIGVNAEGELPDLAFVTVEVVDARGVVCPDAALPLEFAVTGTAAFKAVCNGDATSLEPFIEPRMKTFSGKLVVVLEAGRTAGPAELTVRGAGLPEAKIAVEVEPKARKGKE